MKKFIPTTLAILLTAASAQAADYEIGNPTIAGPGCPSGSVSAVVAPDGSAISILFDDFRLDVPKGTGPVRTKSCTFIIPVKVAPGMVLEASTIDYRGFSSVPRKATASITTAGPIFYHGLYSGGTTNMQQTNGDFTISHTVNQRIARCELQNEIKFTTTISLGGIRARITIPLEADGMIGIDSADAGDGAIKLGVRTRACVR